LVRGEIFAVRLIEIGKFPARIGRTQKVEPPFAFRDKHPLLKQNYFLTFYNLLEGTAALTEILPRFIKLWP
jgi:hypothetical protein